MEERLFMKINHIREFLLLVSNRNFSKTAEQLYMAQSALSRHISSIKTQRIPSAQQPAADSVYRSTSVRTVSMRIHCKADFYFPVFRSAFAHYTRESDEDRSA